MFSVIHQKTPSVCIYSDASNLAWVSSLGEQETGGHWNDSEINYHIKTKEILPVYFSLKSFASKLRVSVKLCIDNTAKVAAIRHMGTSHSDIINRYTKYIWEWCIQRDIWLIPIYVCNEDNFADAPSRKLYLDGEWMLKKCIFQKALQFTPETDLSVNKQIDKYVSFKPDPEAFYVTNQSKIP